MQLYIVVPLCSFFSLLLRFISRELKMIIIININIACGWMESFRWHLKRLPNVCSCAFYSVEKNI